MHVSIPFIAGQWSLRSSCSCGGAGAARFNPLHCGAVVASRKEIEARRDAEEFQSPSLRGSGRFWTPPGLVGSRTNSFQSPSLRGSGRFRSRGPFPNATLSSFNPLHCGAVVASPS